MTGSTGPLPSASTSFAVRLPAQPESAGVARRMLSGLLAASPASPQVVADAELVLHELVANGVVHGRADHDGQIAIACAVAAGHLDLSVQDYGTTGTVAVRPWTDDAPSGRGLAIVSAICETWQVDRTHGTLVSARIRW